MEIRTKFNIGDFLYVIDKYNKWAIVEEGKVYEILPEIGKGYIDINYKLECKGKVHKYYITEHETICFATKEEAQRECNNRNNTNAAKQEI